MSESSDRERSSSPVQESKRKRAAIADDDELEIDLKLPEPPSKKAKRQQKKNEKKAATSTGKSAAVSDTEAPAVKPQDGQKQEDTSARRSESSVWIGNLMWTTTKEELRQFFVARGEIEKFHITRIHMPAPQAKGPGWKGPKPVNKGFAYVDFLDDADMHRAIELSEQLLGGRKVLIKNAKSFEGRPEPKAEEDSGKQTSSQKVPSKRIFVGGLGFDVEKDDLHKHFEQAGEIEDVFMATFEDTGKCKGFGFIRFTSLEAAQAAVDGYVYKAREEAEDSDGEDDAEDAVKPNAQEDGSAAAEQPKKQKKQRKWYINRLQGKQLRCEFAEDAQSRYKKRFGKEARNESRPETRTSDEAPIRDVSQTSSRLNRKPDADQRQAQRRKKHEDARLIAPGRALANAKRATGAIVSATGTKTKFE